MDEREAIKELQPFVDNEHDVYTHNLQNACKLAIDALEKQIPKKKMKATNDVREKLVNIVKRASYHCLPSNTQDFHINMFVTDLLAHSVTVQDVPDNNIGKWISVKDRLPKCGEKVLVYIKFSQDSESDFEDEICQSTYRGKLVGTKKDVWTWQSDYVTHWMPLPEPPEGE